MTKTTDESEPKFTQEDIDRAESAKSNQTKQIVEQRKQIEQLQKDAETKRTAEDAKKNEELLANQKYKELAAKAVKTSETNEAKYKTDLQTLETKIKNMEIDSAIASTGITQELTILGLKAKYNALDVVEGTTAPAIGDWLTSLKTAEPDLFKAVDNTLENKPAGTPLPTGTRLTDEVAKEYEKSDDPEKQKQAYEFYDEKYRTEAIE